MNTLMIVKERKSNLVFAYKNKAGQCLFSLFDNKYI